MRAPIRVLLSALALLLAVAAHAQGPSDPATGLSTDFRNWLSANGYGSYNLARAAVAGGSAVVTQPVISTPGNPASALGTVSPYTGWYNSIGYFKSQGYTSAELYATTW